MGQGAGNTLTFTQPSSGSTPVTTSFNLTVGSPNAPYYGFPEDFTTIDDLEVTIDVRPSDTCDQLSIVLVPPTGTGLAPITLLVNGVITHGNHHGLRTTARVDGLGANTDTHTFGANNSIVHNIGTVFDRDAPRSHHGRHRRPALRRPLPAGNLHARKHRHPAEFNGLTPSDVEGTWTLQITDYVNSGTTSRRSI